MNGESDLQFVDTNILVYAYDLSAGEKHQLARSILQHLWQTKTGCLSVQVMQELFVTLTQKVQRPLSTDKARMIVADFSTWQVHAPDGEDVLGAIDIQQRFQLSFWDAMILRSASQLGAKVVFSEDLIHGQDYGGFQVVNPLGAA